MDMYLTEKALALLSAVEAGLVREDENGNIDDETFQLFWENFSLRRGLKHDLGKILVWCLPWSIAILSTALLIGTVL